ncbi:hypothetical protein [Burkholderia cenocepacia]|uniref:hypothetical protein n=1 Tax=Burkholderia cenocepacia TaxID=95486 RepID=UPI00078C8497|nr:hypothetical protein [Burkholderia cenocepacia]AMU11435.1 hypothetical protein A2T82_34665 [Burkholderia cenocepacia]MBO1858692.1 hypothetical protein [Burkholderia cenocepacia]MCW3536949.1 hypothetical protein [Burkholderia cenocepacia]MCW3663324.1 hypothetical protein [Burkholderia cenocepacia]MDN7692603.1 hypothetical protein [Burkholderia cenocepacia]
MTRRSQRDAALDIALVRQLQLQQAISRAAQARAALDVERVRQQQVEAEHDAHLATWHGAAQAAQLSPALLANCSAALDSVSMQRDAASRRVDMRTTELEVVRAALQQRDRLADAADRHALHAEQRHRAALDERRMTELEIRAALCGGNR